MKNSKSISNTLIIGLSFVFLACTEQSTLHPVTTSEFSHFVHETNYITDAEQYGWSIIQEDVFNFRVENDLNWKRPIGKNLAQSDYPVTQVSYNDAIAYCNWANTRLPNYEEYWQLTKDDDRTIIEDFDTIYPTHEVNIVGNVWEITMTENARGEVRLAGGSYLCHPNTCNGVQPDRKLYVDKTTGNTHIGFSVVTTKE